MKELSRFWRYEYELYRDDAARNHHSDVYTRRYFFRQAREWLRDYRSRALAQGRR